MLASIIQSLSSALGDVMEGFMTLFLDALNMNLSSFLDVFPLLATFYTYLRSFSVALAAIIAGKALATFWFGSLDNSAKDNPLMILMKTFFAVAAIYWGGYVLEYIVHLGSIPYDRFLNIEAVTDGKVYFKEFISGFFGFAAASVSSWSSLAKGLCEIFLLIVIAWNLFKLVVEICERWLMVGVLVYTSPLIYCTIPSSDTSGIFRKWCSMFVGAVIQMSLSVMFLKLILSGFNAGSSNYVIKLLMILAMCKIAQRVDTYLQQLGVGVATTGGNMVDDLIAGAQGLNRLTGRFGGGKGEHGSRGSILGSYAGRTNLGAGLNAAAAAFRSGAGVRETAKAGVKGAADNLVHQSPAGRAVTAAWAAHKAAQSQNGTNPADSKSLTVSGMSGSSGKAGPQKPAGSPVDASGPAASRSAGASRGNASSGTSASRPTQSEDTAGKPSGGQTAGAQTTPWQAAKSGFMSGTAYMLGLNGDRSEYSQEELRASENNARANAAAVADEAQEYQSGGGVMPDELREDAKQLQEGKGAPRRMSYSENYKEYGTRNEAGNILELNEDDDIQPSIPAAASGVGINSCETPDGAYQLTMTDRCGGRAVSDYMAQAVSQGAIKEDGSRSYAVSMPSKQEYIEKGMDESSYHAAGQEAAGIAQREDAGRIRTYEESMPENAGARLSAESAMSSLDNLRADGAPDEQIHAAEQTYEDARQNLYNETAAAGERQVREAGQRLENLEQQGIDPESAEYQDAASEYRQQQENLSRYKESYTRANTPGAYENVKQQATAEARANDIEKLSESYDSIRDQVRGLLDETIRNSDVFSKARALNNPGFIPADIPQTRQMAYDVFKDAVTDIKPGTGFDSVQVRDLPPSSDNPGRFENQGGREIMVSYRKKDGTAGTRTFLNGKGASALPSSVSSQYSVFKSADGRHWLTDDPEGMHRTAPPSGRQVREPSLITNIFTAIRKKPRKG